MNKIKAILFDKDGTLFNFAATWEAWAQAFLYRLASGPDHAADLGRAIGFDVVRGQFLPDSIAIAGTPAEVMDALCSSLPDMAPADILNAINEEATRAPLVEAAPLGALLQDLRRRGLRLGVVTNDAEALAHAHLEAANVSECFDFIAGFDSGFGAKPDPGPLLAFADKVGVAPDATLMVGDSLEHDIGGAQNVGFSSALVRGGVHSNAFAGSLQECELDRIIHELSARERVDPPTFCLEYFA